ncbi:MAG: hypothetical protein LC754_00160 [Acidobacteria bacterium]|nr:hypothetical protein [Acidobacteriota bacterium]
MSHGYQGERAEARGQHPTRVLRITAPGGAAEKPAILLMRSHHAREWINALAVVETARQLTENFRPGDADPLVKGLTGMLERVEIIIVPESNPDGARLSFFDAGRRMWRKNLRQPDAGACPGVDCNRNFPQFFGEAGSSSSPCAETYHGPRPLSEPEARNIATLAERQRNIVFAIDSHSHGQAIFRPSPGGGQFVTSEPVSAADDAIYRHLEERMNATISGIQGARYETGSTSNHAGTTDEFLFFVHRVFAFDLECGLDFQPPEADAVLAALEVAEATKALGLCAAGATGLDVSALLARRRELEFDATEAVADDADARSAPWEIEPLAEEHWRRFRARLAPLAGAAGWATDPASSATFTPSPAKGQVRLTREGHKGGAKRCRE